MPAKFDKCREEGGKIRTINVGKEHYAHVCVLPGNQKGKAGGKTVIGEIKMKKSKTA